MEVHRQQCQACGGHEHQVLLVREAGQSQVVFLRCLQCKALVARYELSAYYHHGRGYESWLASFRGVAESGRDLLARFGDVKTQAVQQFEKVMARLRADGRD